MIAVQGTEGWRSLKDTDMTQLCLNLERGGFQNITKDLIRDAISFVAEQNAFDSAQHWLDLKVWDGVPRIAQFLPTYMGTADTAYTRAVGLYIWSAMAGRVCTPGIKADMVPVAVGAQGTRKSTAVAALVPHEDFFTTIDLSGQDDDLARKMRGKLVVELDELKGLGSRDAEHIKSFTSRRFEEWTPKYREQTVRYARRSICFGTSNQDDFLVDATGNRRWLPFDCGTCDTDAIARDREQLWAEGRDVFLQSGIQHLEAERLANGVHGAFAAHDDWDEVINKWLITEEFTGGAPGAREFLTGGEVLSGAIGLPISQQSPANAARVKRCMVRLGYVHTRLRHEGGRQRAFLAPSLF
jgi:predicted P-loop ATPase